MIHSINNNSLKNFLVVVVSADDKNNKENDKDKNHDKDMIIDGTKLKI